MTLRAPALIFLLIIAALGIAGAWFNAPFDPLWRLALGVFVIALLIEYVLVQRLAFEVRIIPVGHALLGRTCRWQAVLTNINRQKVAVRFTALPPAEFTGDIQSVRSSIEPGEQVTQDFSQVAERLGQWRWPNQPVEVVGPFGLAAWIRHIACESEGDAAFITDVEPDILPQRQLRMAMSAYGAQRNPRSAEHGTEFHALREYVQGDDASLINWKASSRVQRLVVKETELEQQLLLYCVLDCGLASSLRSAQLTALGRSVNMTAHLSQLAQANGDRYGLLAYADEVVAQIAPGHGLTHQRQFRQALSGLKSGRAYSNPLMAVHQVRRHLTRRALVIFFTNLDDSAGGGELARAVAMLRPRHLPLIVALEDPEIAQSATMQVDSQEQLFSGLAAQEYQRGLQQSRLRLERLGATVVHAVPDQVDVALMQAYQRLRARNQV